MEVERENAVGMMIIVIWILVYIQRNNTKYNYLYIATLQHLLPQIYAIFNFADRFHIRGFTKLSEKK